MPKLKKVTAFAPLLPCPSRLQVIGVGSALASLPFSFRFFNCLCRRRRPGRPYRGGKAANLIALFCTELPPRFLRLRRFVPGFTCPAVLLSCRQGSLMPSQVFVLSRLRESLKLMRKGALLDAFQAVVACTCQRQRSPIVPAAVGVPEYEVNMKILVPSQRPIKSSQSLACVSPVGCPHLRKEIASSVSVFQMMGAFAAGLKIT